MSDVVFYFDFTSPYGYLGAERIGVVFAGDAPRIAWRPILLGAILRETGARPLIEVPLKGAYARRDLERTARRFGIPFRFPATFPFKSVAAARAFYSVSEESPEQARDLALALYRAAFGEGRDIAHEGAVADVGADLGYDREAFLERLKAPHIKDRLRRETDDAMARGVFGSPFVTVNGEPFWGVDHLEEARTWLETGGW
jgi:2-hydroxychromene-2-carboxylate isomerase